MEFSIRAATDRDTALILEFIRQLAAYEKLLHEVVATEDALRGHLFGTAPAAEVVFGEVDGEPVAFALFFRTFSTFVGKPGIYLEDLFVKPEMRGRGYGRRMLAYLAHLAVSRGYGRVEWAVLDWNEPAIGFYRSLGARPNDGWIVNRLAGDALRALADQHRPS